MSKKRKLIAIILAAGEGTRMKSQTPKVLQTLAGRSLLDWVLRSARYAGAEGRVVVLGHEHERVRKTLPSDVATTVQARQLGTGHAVQTARAGLKNLSGDVLVLCGDAPLIRPQTLKRLLATHRRLGAAATVLTAEVRTARGYGRVVRDTQDPRWVARIVEERDASAAERAIREINSGAYCFSLPLLWKVLGRLKNSNRKREYYLTDVVELLRRQGEKVAAYRTPEENEILGVNTRQDLARAGSVLNQRKLQALMDSGVTIWDPASTWVDPDVKVGPDTEIWPGTFLTGSTVVGRKNRIGPQTHLDCTRTGEAVSIRYSILERSVLGNHVRVGPFSHLRPGTKVESYVVIGNYAETNRSRIKQGVKIGHMSYIGDATVGRHANIGAGVITANFDGARKHATRIGEQAFLGSSTVLVAPCSIGRRALTGAGAVVKAGTRVPAETVVVGVPARVLKKRAARSR